MESFSASGEQVDRNEFGPLAAENNTNSDSGQQKHHDGEEPGEGGEPSTMDQIGHDQPQESWMSLDYTENELYGLLGGDTQGTSPLGDFENIQTSAGFEDSGFLSVPLTFGEDDVPFSLEEFEVPDEDDTNQGETGGWVT